MKKIWQRSGVAIMFLFVALTVGVESVFAQNQGTLSTNPCTGSGCLINPLGNTTSVSGVLANISSFLLIIAAPICGIMVVVGGFQMLTAAGDPAKFKTGRQTLLYAAIGFVVVLFASQVVPLLKSVLGGS